MRHIVLAVTRPQVSIHWQAWDLNSLPYVGFQLGRLSSLDPGFTIVLTHVLAPLAPLLLLLIVLTHVLAPLAPLLLLPALLTHVLAPPDSLLLLLVVLTHVLARSWFVHALACCTVLGNCYKLLTTGSACLCAR